MNIEFEAVVCWIMQSRGCSRLNAVSHAMHAYVDEYNEMQARLGCHNKTVIVDEGQLLPRTAQ